MCLVFGALLPVLLLLKYSFCELKKQLFLLFSSGVYAVRLTASAKDPVFEMGQSQVSRLGLLHREWVIGYWGSRHQS